KRTISIERNNLLKNVPIQDIIISSNQKSKFNPLLYECDLYKLKIIKDTIHKLLHEIINNDFLCDLITLQYTINKIEKKILYDNIKKQINFNEKDKNGELILNDKILTILNELKILYHDDIHKHMGYPLQLYQIC
ncbi:hypothetical protein RFI_37173, partial [Reticulomyxa filosa]